MHLFLNGLKINYEFSINEFLFTGKCLQPINTDWFVSPYRLQHWSLS